MTDHIDLNISNEVEQNLSNSVSEAGLIDSTISIGDSSIINLQSEGDSSAKSKKTKVDKSKSTKKDKSEKSVSSTNSSEKDKKKAKTPKKDKEEKKIKKEFDSSIENLDYREVVLNYDPSKHKIRKRITQSEIALLLGKRTTMIAHGAKPNIEVKPGMTAYEIAKEELRQKKTPFMFQRPIGDKYEVWKLKDMEIVNF